jgi:hypothetical protein
LSAEQKNVLKTIQDELENEWKDKKGMSGKSSPSVGDGWLGLLSKAQKF